MPYEVRAKAEESALSVVVVETAKQALAKVDELIRLGQRRYPVRQCAPLAGLLASVVEANHRKICDVRGHFDGGGTERWRAEDLHNIEARFVCRGQFNST